MSSWDHGKLDVLLADIEAIVREGIEYEDRECIPEDEGAARVVGYWMYRLLECKPGAQLRGPQRSITGPLFREQV